MGLEIGFSQLFYWDGGWDTFPSLDNLHTTQVETDEEAKQAALRLSRSVSKYCEDLGINLISLEISVLSEEKLKDGDAKFATHLYSHPKFDVFFKARQHQSDSLEQKTLQSPYKLAMDSMLGDKPGFAGMSVEPILFHPDLRSGDHGYVIGLPHPLKDEPPETPYNFVPDKKFKAIEAINFTAPKFDQFKTSVADQADNFLYFLSGEIKKLLLSNPGWDSHTTKKAKLLQKAQLVIFPFIRDVRREDGNSRRTVEASYGEPVSGVFFFALLSPKDASKEEDAHRLARYFARLCFGMSMREQGSALRKIENQGAAIEDTAHDIVNVINNLRVDQLKTLLFGNQSSSTKLSKDLLEWGPLDINGTLDISDEADADKELLVRYITKMMKSFKRAKVQLEILELAYGDRQIRLKHQAFSESSTPSGFSLAEVIQDAMDLYESDNQEKVIISAIFPDKIPSTSALRFPPNYIKKSYLVEEFYELIRNVGNYGIQKEGRKEVNLHVWRAGNEESQVIRLRISNETQEGLDSTSRKKSSLSSVPGISIKHTTSTDKKNSRHWYKVDITLGAIEVQLDNSPEDAIWCKPFVKED